MRIITATLAAVSLSAIALTASPVVQAQSSTSSASRVTDSYGPLKVRLPKGLKKSDLGDRDVRNIAVQVMLDRSRHSPGVIDGRGGGNTNRAIAAYRKANGLKDGTNIDTKLIRSLLNSQTGDIFRTYAVTAKDVNYDYVEIPDGFEAKSKLKRLSYSTPLERFAENFHMDQDFLKAMNPKVDFGKLKEGDKLNVVSRRTAPLDIEIASIEIRKGNGELVALDKNGKLLASFPATIGSGDFPSPSGDMTVNAIAPAASYTFDPDDQRWGPDKKFMIAAGPNNPVGGVWIDLSKDGYGIHGSPDPQLIGKTTSHGCVRLTNWDARELMKAVKRGTPVKFI